VKFSIFQSLVEAPTTELRGGVTERLLIGQKFTRAKNSQDWHPGNFPRNSLIARNELRKFFQITFLVKKNKPPTVPTCFPHVIENITNDNLHNVMPYTFAKYVLWVNEPKTLLGFCS
jgi:hypothetical protein